MNFDRELHDEEVIKVMKAASKTFKRCIPKEEIENLSLIELWKATKKDFDSRDKFRVFLYRKIKWACLNYLFKEQDFLSKHQLDDRVSENEDYNKIQFHFECMDMLDEMPTLTEKDRELIYQRFVLNMTFREMGNCHGISPQLVSKKMKRIFKDKGVKNS